MTKSKKLTPDEIREKCDTASKNMDTFYKQGVAMRISHSDTVAQYLLDNSELWEKIQKITRQNSYNRDHSAIEPGEKATNCIEEWTAKAMFTHSKKFGHKFGAIGSVIDYQIQLKNTLKDKEAGKIDMMSLSADGQELYLIEMKQQGTGESLLRCVLEIYTYFRQIDKNKLKKDFELNNNPKVVPVVAIFTDSKPYKQIKKYSKVVELIKSLHVKVAILSGEACKKGEVPDGSKISVAWWSGNDE